ncbi:MAG: hypothetical protein GEU91_06180 [Rhizobiales bacterium]|nr:hypothetical protein [Hyphomicrobiales bacterium]
MRKIAGLIVLSIAVAGCSAGGVRDASSGSESSPGITDRISSFFSTGGSSRPQRPAGQPPLEEEIDCPSVTVREGASTLTVRTGGEPSAMTLRYQGTIGRTARECKVVARTLQMKVGMEGRIIMGPAGGAGSLDVPLRFAVVREGPQPVTVITKTYRVPVTITAGASNVPFVQIDEDLTFPLPAAQELESYVVYVGFDPEALKRPEPRRRRAVPRRKG